jgi:Holliday junction DNA helicase RuvA
MVVELRDRIGPLPLSDGAPAGMLRGDWQEQVRQGVLALGWTVAQADQAVAAVAESIDGDVPPVPVLLRQAIRLLGKTR